MKRKNGKIKEHIYSKGKLIYKNPNREDGKFSCKEEMILQIMQKDNSKLGQFIIETFGLNQEPDIMQQNNIKYIINEISSNEIKKEIFNKLFLLENYDPYINDFPIDIFASNIQRLIKKKQKFILDNVDFFEINTINNLKSICKYDKKDNSLNFLLKQNDIVFLYNSYTFIIASNNIDLTNIYAYLQFMEPNKWILEKRKHRIYLKYGKKSRLYLPSLYKYLIHFI